MAQYPTQETFLRSPQTEISMTDSTTMTRHRSGKAIKRGWHVLDASNRILGDVATQAAHLLRGKHKTDFSPHLNLGDYVVVINADKVQVSGNKGKGKIYHFHSGYVGNMKDMTFDEMKTKHPARIIELAVKGMIKGTRLGRTQLHLLKVYAGGEHPHGNHQPQPRNF